MLYLSNLVHSTIVHVHSIACGGSKPSSIDNALYGLDIPFLKFFLCSVFSNTKPTKRSINTKIKSEDFKIMLQVFDKMKKFITC